MTSPAKIRESDFVQDDTLTIDGHDNAIVGITVDGVVVYNQGRILENLVEQGMTPDEAIEFFDFNIAGSHMGVFTPIILAEMFSEPCGGRCYTLAKMNEAYSEQ